MKEASKVCVKHVISVSKSRSLAILNISLGFKNGSSGNISKPVNNIICYIYLVSLVNKYSQMNQVRNWGRVSFTVRSTPDFQSTTGLDRTGSHDCLE